MARFLWKRPNLFGSRYLTILKVNAAREVGIIVCLYAYSYFCGLAYEEGKAELNETMANRYHLLREYVNTLENESQNRIYRAID